MFKRIRNTPLFTDEKEINLFCSLFNEMDDENHVKVAKSLFVDGKTFEETAEQIGYCKRQIERIAPHMLKVALKRSIRKLLILENIQNE